MAKGYILLHRQIWENELWLDTEPFNKRDAWIDLLLMANHSDKEMLSGTKTVKIERGQIHTSVQNLAKRWRWNPKRVRRFIGLLNDLGMVQAKGSANGTTLTLVNYGVYQDSGQGKGSAKGSTKGLASGSGRGSAKGSQTNNVINNERSNERNNERSNRQTADDINAIFEKMRKEGKL